ncbi:dicarboxylate/amino acid:cation symporter [Dolosicoccus paucivorans]|uniref:Dicarboxylate/amino acid:cation symporter n=1 Tax=Dolosicoccus paucivorans TaxID=84521 RepID=A0A2N6SPR2_9LACT|nr:dicarboxylate/amino acid:cation symporter [Dolosicoccus paucivorans]PMB84421.1 dicarboxylate/amino acid:cation symporter [Dolosicoccus paucivorans]PMC59050.1 dicarboxylate/amino acid:cation symporter [Dolosicoccus paucivorans]
MKSLKVKSLTTKIFIALLGGLLTGILINQFFINVSGVQTFIVDGVFKIFGQGFIAAMQMLVVPLVFCSLVTGTMSMGDTKKLGSIGVKTLAFYLFTTSLAIAIALGLGVIFKPGLGMNLALDPAQAAEVAVADQDLSFTNTIIEMIPKNPIQALAEGDMLKIIVFAIVVGIVLANMADRGRQIANLFEELNDMMMDMTNLVMTLAPIGVFSLIARTFSTLGFGAILSMLKYMMVVFLSLFVQQFGVYIVLLVILARVNPFIFIKKFIPVMTFAFSTSSSNATVPVNIQTLENMGVSRRISSFTIPLGATVNMDGTAIMQGVAIVFAANAYGITLTPRDYLIVIATATLASVGTAGIPSVGLVTLTMVFASVGLPVEAIAMIMGIDRILDMTRTAVNITGDAVCTLIMAKQAKDGSFDEKQYYKATT